MVWRVALELVVGSISATSAGLLDYVQRSLFSWLFNRVNIELPKSLSIALAMLAYAFPVLVVTLAAVLIHRTLKPTIQENIGTADSDLPEAIQPIKQDATACIGHKYSKWEWPSFCSAA